jgi:hypothetical protein
MEAAKVLVEEGGADPTAADRWGHSPITEAERVGTTKLVAFLKGACRA